MQTLIKELYVKYLSNSNDSIISRKKSNLKMGKRFEQAFHQRRYTNGYHAH